MNESRDQIICACFDVTLGQIERIVKTEPNLTFDDMMSRTGAGTRCTACLLDLEYFFVSGNVPRDRTRRRTPTPRRNLKRKIYDFIDSLSPWRPEIVRTFAPVVSGNGIEEYFWVANRPMLFNDDDFPATPHRYKYFIRDKNGTVRQCDEIALPAGCAKRINISNAIKGDDLPFSVGALEVHHWAEKRGVRGTTRPQIEILTDVAACSVHTQGPYRTAFKDGTTIPLTPDDRVFLIFMNPFNRQLSGNITIGERSLPIDVPPFGTEALEVSSNLIFDRAQADKQPELVFAEWNMDGGCKVYMICANLALNRFSVDHV